MSVKGYNLKEDFASFFPFEEYDQISQKFKLGQYKEIIFQTILLILNDGLHLQYYNTYQKIPLYCKALLISP